MRGVALLVARVARVTGVTGLALLDEARRLSCGTACWQAVLQRQRPGARRIALSADVARFMHGQTSGRATPASDGRGRARVTGVALFAYVWHCLEPRRLTMRNRLSTVPSSAEVPSDVAQTNLASAHFAAARIAIAPHVARHFRTADAHAGRVQ